ncbi:hypothetical protein BZA77DRAFT_363410 [Pyronema omphalodes]|nr:hypothetical protein BZA77DRAFT_363410 [Pyronema omphalodes]
MSIPTRRSVFLYSLLERSVALYIPLLQWVLSILIMISSSLAIFDHNIKPRISPIDPEFIILLCASVPYLLWFLQYLRRVYNAPPWRFIISDLVMVALYVAPTVLLGIGIWGSGGDKGTGKWMPDLGLLKGIFGLAILQGGLFLGTAMGRVCLVVEECRKQKRRREERDRLEREMALKERKFSEVTVGSESTLGVQLTVGNGDNTPVLESAV